jgi:hypothetical protein
LSRPAATPRLSAPVLQIIVGETIRLSVAPALRLRVPKNIHVARQRLLGSAPVGT